MKKHEKVPKKLTIVDDWAFNDEPLDYSDGYTEVHDIRIPKTSYIFAFTGRRGSGKTTCMTFFACRLMTWQNMRCLSNYPIEFLLAKHLKDGKVRYFRKASEPLDLYKLLCFDEDYHNCLILMDEAPDIISSMAAMSWKNRLLNIFIRQLRKNGNTLFLASQNLKNLDRSVVWQTDIEIACSDLSQIEGGPNSTSGSLIGLKWYDLSGIWTGETTDERIAHAHYRHEYGEDIACADKTTLLPSFLWGKRGKTRPVFDTNYTMDIWESLKRVDTHFGTYRVGGPESSTSVDKFPVSHETLSAALAFIENFIQAIPEADSRIMAQRELYRNLGPISDRDRNNLGRKLSDFGVGRAGSGNERVYAFGESFDLEGFKAFVEDHRPAKEES